MAGGACRYSLRLDTVQIDFPAPGDRGGIAGSACGRVLVGVVPGERLDTVVAELGCHSPHVRECIGVAACLGAEIPELALEVIGVLPGQTRKLGLLAVAVWTVAACRYCECKLARRLVSAWVGIRRLSGTTAAARQSGQNRG